MKHNVIIIGAGGFAKVVADIIEQNNDKVVGILDDNIKGKFLDKYNILGKISDANRFNRKNIEFIIAIGNIGFREKVANINKNFKYYKAIHPKAIVSKNSKIESGAVICAGAVINPNAVIKSHSIINANAVIEHDCIIGKFVNVDANSTILGEAIVMAKNHIKTTRIVERKEVIDMEKASENIQKNNKINVLITGKNSYIGVKAKEYLEQDEKYIVKELDMLDETWEYEKFSSFDVVIHVAGIAHVSNDKKLDDLYFKVNRDLAIKVANKAKKEGVKQFIFMSSMIIYGNDASFNQEKIIDETTVPEAENAYGKSKLEADLAIQALADDTFNTVVIRTPMVYGPGCKGNFARLKKLARISPIFPDIDNKRSMIYVYNLCEFYKQAIERKYSGVYYPQNTEYISTKDIMKYLAEEQGKKIRFVKLFNPLLRILSKKVNLINKVFGNKVYSKELTQDFSYNLVDNETSIRESIRQEKGKKALVLASVASMIQQFNMDNIRLLQELGYEVEVATNFENCGTITKERSLALQQELKEMNVVCHQINFDRSVFSANNLKAYKEVKKVINDNSYELIHMHSPIGGVCGRIAARKTRKKNNTKVIYTAHGFHFYKGAPLKNWLMFYPIEKWLSRYTDILITINQEDYDLAKKKFHTKQTELIHGIGVNPDKFNFEMSEEEKDALRKEIGIGKDDFVMICIGELNDNKNQIMQIEAVKELAKENKKIKLLLVGKGENKDFIENKIKEYNIENNIKLLGYRSDVPKLLKISNVLLSTSKREGLPVNVIEALMAGIPVIATNCRGNRDLIEDGVNGYLVGIDDIETLKNSVQQIRSKNCINIENINNSSKEYDLKSILLKVKNIYGFDEKENDIKFAAGKISVIMGIYNCEKYLKEAINSIINQTYTNWELIMCEDGSKDNTYAIAEEYANNYPDKIVLIKNEKNMGLNYTLNECLKHVTGEFIARQDGDDICDKDRFAKQVEFLRNNPEYALVTSNMNLFDESGIWGKTSLKEKPVNLDFVKGSPFCHAACMIRTKVMNEVNGYTVDDKLLRVEDYHLWFKVYEKGYLGYNIQECLYSMRDDKDAVNRRTWKNRMNEFYVKRIGFKMLHIPKRYYVYILKPILVGMLPKKIYTYLRRKNKTK